MNALLSNRVAQALRGLGPYVLIELLLPGGTLFAMLLWLYRRAASDESRSLHHSKKADTAIECALRRAEPPILPNACCC